MHFDLVCFGELLWDFLPSGKVAGGAPFNIVNRANALGLKSVVISSVGHDKLGGELIQLAEEKGNNPEFIQVHENLSTGIVNILVNQEGEPEYDIVHPVAWDDIVNTDKIKKVISSSRAFVYSSLGLRDVRSREVLFELLPFADLRICDINLRQGQYCQETIIRMMKEAHILKMNEDELGKICQWCGFQDMDFYEQLKQLRTLYNYQAVIVTLGSNGAMCYNGSDFHHQPVFQVVISDTVGSGDAFLASYIYKKLNHSSDSECLRFACAVGAITASKNGGTPEISVEEISALLKTA